MESFVERKTTFNADKLHGRVDVIKKPSGRLKERVVIDYPKAVVIIPFLPPDRFVVVSQYRYAQQKYTLEFPAGKVDFGESSEKAAFRELLEETGYVAGSLKKIYSYAPALSYSTEILDIFFASDLEFDQEYDVDPDEIQRSEVISKNELWNRVYSENLLDPDLVLGILLCEKFKLI